MVQRDNETIYLIAITTYIITYRCVRVLLRHVTDAPSNVTLYLLLVWQTCRWLSRRVCLQGRRLSGILKNENIVINYLSTFTDAKSSLYARNYGYTEPVLNL